MKKIGLITNFERDKDLEYTKEIVNYLLSRDCHVLVDNRLGERLGLDDRLQSYMQVYGQAEMLIILGGDGTILSAARHAAIYELPIFGINLGNLGYLAGAEKAEGKSAIDKVLKGEYDVEKRMMLQVLDSDRSLKIGLNDVYIRNKESAHMLKTNIWVNNQYIDTYKGDGVIIVSPTGSTAYNLSAGGPVLKPDTSLIAITQICPHNLYARPLVVSGDDEVSISVEGSETNAAVYIDGVNLSEIKKNEKITIKKAEYYTQIVKTTKLGFYDVLRSKMAWHRD